MMTNFQTRFSRNGINVTCSTLALGASIYCTVSIITHARNTRTWLPWSNFSQPTQRLTNHITDYFVWWCLLLYVIASAANAKVFDELLTSVINATTWLPLPISERVVCVFSSTGYHSDSHQTTSGTYSSQSLPLHPGPHCGTPVAETCPTDKPGNGGSNIFHRRTESMEPAADWTEKNTIDICLSPRTENVSFQLCILLWITHDIMTM